MAQSAIIDNVFRVIDKTTKPLHDMAEKMEKLKQKSEGLKGFLERHLGGVLATAGVSLGLGEMAHKMIEIGEAAEGTERRIRSAWLMSGRFTSLGPQKEYEIAVKKSGEAYEEIVEMSKKGVASTETYANVFNTLVGPALSRTKATQKEVLELTKNLIPTMAAVTGSTEGAVDQANAFAIALATGQARLPREMARALHITRKQWEVAIKHGPEAMFKLVEDRTKKYGPLAQAQFGGLSTMTGRVRVNVEDFMRKLGKPVLTGMTEKAKQLAEWFEKNKVEIDATANIWGNRIVKGMELASNLLEFMAKHAKVIAATMAVAFGPGIVKGIASRGLLGAGSMVTGAGNGILAAKGMLDTFRLLKMEGGSLANSFKFLGGGAGNTLGALSTMAGQLAIAAAAGYALGTAFDKLFDLSGKLANWFGKITGQQDPRSIDTTPAFKAKIKKFQSANDEIVEMMQAEAKKGKHANKKTLNTLFELQRSRGKDQIAGLERIKNEKGGIQALGRELEEKKSIEKGMSKNFKPETNFNFQNSRFDIKQMFAEGADPDRIAVAFTNDLASLGEQAKQSNFGTFSGGR